MINATILEGYKTKTKKQYSLTFKKKIIKLKTTMFFITFFCSWCILNTLFYIFFIKESFQSIEDQEEEAKLKEKEKEKEKKTEVKYEDKYWDKFNNLKNSICPMDQLSQRFIMDYTPNGNVIMKYNPMRETFEYYSDKTMTFAFLETVARRYVITFECPYLYIIPTTTVTKTNNKIMTKNRYTHLGKFNNCQLLQPIPTHSQLKYRKFKKQNELSF